MQLFSKIICLCTKIRFYKIVVFEKKLNGIAGFSTIIIARQQKKLYKIFFAFVLLNSKNSHSFLVSQNDSQWNLACFCFIETKFHSLVVLS
jgi:hypothetical protein